MPAPLNRPTLREQTVSAFSPSIGASPIVAVARVPFRGFIKLCGLNQVAAVTGTASVQLAINGANVTGGAVSVTGGAAGTLFSAVPTGNFAVNEDDVLTWTPSGATGASIGATCFAVIQAG